MKILALDSSGLVASVAVVENDSLIAEYTMNYKKTHSQTLLPMLEEVRKNIELDLESIDAIAIAAGPGSFTGLRIGSATVKGLGLALHKPIIPVPTVDALAYNAYGVRTAICPIMDARRSQVYTGIYTFQAEGEAANGKLGEAGCAERMKFVTIKSQCVTAIETLAEELNTLEREVLFIGDGIPVFARQLEKIMKVPYRFAPAHLNRQRAASVAVLGEIYMIEGRTEEAGNHAPEYLRLSQAERERQEALKKPKE